MKPLLTTAIALLTGWVLGGCSNLPPRFAVGEEAKLTEDGLRPLDRSGFARAWLRSDTSFAKYDRIYVDCSEISYRSPPRSGRAQMGAFVGDNFALPAEMKTHLEASCRTIFRAEVSRGGVLPSADESHAGVLLVRVVLGDLVVHAPLDVSAGDGLVWMVSAGEITLLIELYDAETGALIGRLLERRALATGTNRGIRATPGAVTYETQRIFRGWAKSLRSLLDAMRNVDPIA